MLNKKTILETDLPPSALLGYFQVVGTPYYMAPEIVKGDR